MTAFPSSRTRELIQVNARYIKEQGNADKPWLPFLRGNIQEENNMQETKHYCDHCAKQLLVEELNEYIVDVYLPGLNHGNKKELCTKCFDLILDWLKPQTDNKKVPQKRKGTTKKGHDDPNNPNYYRHF